MSYRDPRVKAWERKLETWADCTLVPWPPVV